jgi:hypothetical protein
MPAIIFLMLNGTENRKKRNFALNAGRIPAFARNNRHNPANNADSAHAFAFALNAVSGRVLAIVRNAVSGRVSA